MLEIMGKKMLKYFVYLNLWSDKQAETGGQGLGAKLLFQSAVFSAWPGGNTWALQWENRSSRVSDKASFKPVSLATETS